MKKDDGLAIVLTTVGGRDAADRLARTLVQERLAACVSAGAVRSTYRWKDAVEQEDEVLLVIKTAQVRLEALLARLSALHPYEVPEVVTLQPARVAPSYLAWALDACAAPDA